MGFRLFCHESNQGKGSAVRTALRHAQGRIVVVQDADQELDPHDLLPMFEALSHGEAAVCYGSRFARGAGHLRWRATYWANRFLNAVCNLLNGLKLTDMNTCYKMMPADVLRRLDLVSRGFTLEPEITTKLARLGIGIIERPVSYRPRNYLQGKKIHPSMFFHYLAALVRFRFFWRQDQARQPERSHLQETVQCG
jgi:glycosyltransferase involved in cell wall biosynthesis